MGVGVGGGGGGGCLLTLVFGIRPPLAPRVSMKTIKTVFIVYTKYYHDSNYHSTSS